MEDPQNPTKMFQRYTKVTLELIILLASAAYIYLEELFWLIVGKPIKSLDEDVILVTGSANGLGYELCRELVKYRAKLVLWDVSEIENKKAAEELKALGAQHVFCDRVDVTNREDVKKAAAKIRNQFGHVTILVNNAGVCPMQKFLELTPDAIQATFQTNIISHFWTIQEFLPHMLEVNKGHIVTICSAFGQMAVRGPSPYYSTKHAVHGFIESLKDEISHYPSQPNIKFTTAYPFFMNTRMVSGSNSGLVLNFKFPSITPFMEPSYVAKKIVEGIRRENEYLYIPEHFRIYRAGNFFLPSKLHRLAIDFFVEDDSYSVQHGGTNGFSAATLARKMSVPDHSNGNGFKNGFAKTTSPAPSWLSENIQEKGK